MSEKPTPERLDPPAEARFRDLIENTSDWIWEVDAELRYIYASPKISEFLGYRPEEVLGKTPFDLMPPEEAARLRPGVEDLLRNPAPFEALANVNLHKDGSLRMLETSGVPVFDAAGALRGYRGIDRDITAHKRAQAALRLHAFVQIVPDHVWRLDFDPPVPVSLPEQEQLTRIFRGARFSECNDSVARFLGYADAAQVTGKTLPEVVGESPAGYTGLILHAIRSGFRVTNFEQRTLDSQGNPSWHLCNVLGAIEDGCLVSAWGIERDITERKQLEERLRQAQKLESMGRLAGGLAHEFNNLLTVINGYGDVLLSRLREGDALRPPVEQIRDAGERAARLTRQLLAFSCKQVLQPRPVDLNALIAEHEEMFRGLADAGVEFVIRLAPSLGVVMADGGQIRQVLLNLVANARDAMPSGGVLLIETATAEVDDAYAAEHPEASPGSYVVLSITDGGTGMDEETRQRIFEPFYAPGSSLGLPAAHGIVRQSEGWISVRSEPGVGTTFQVYLPRTQEPLPPEAASVMPGLGVRGQETILVAEDQDAVRKLTVEVLKAQGYKVLEAAGGTEALAAAGRHAGPIHLLVSDVLMPGMSGRELAERLAAVRPRMKVLFMSGYAENLIAQRGVLDPAFFFIPKPFSPRSLALKVRQALGPPALGRILVVDDEEGIRRLLAEILESEGYEVRTAANGAEALKKLKEYGCDLVVTDLVMPEQEGIETIQAIRRSYPETRIIAISGQFEGRFLQVARMMGAQAALLKPIRPDEFLKTVQRVLE